MKKQILIITVLLFVITISNLEAEFNKGSMYIGNHVSAVQLMGGNDNSDVKAWWGLDFDYFFSSRIGTELSASIGWTRPSETKYGKSYITYLYPITANLKFNFVDKAKFVPYGLAGIGILFWDARDITSYTEDYSFWQRRGSAVHGGMQKDAIANAGFGFHFFLSERWALESSFRYHMILEAEKDMSGYGDQHSGLWAFRVGIGYVFGGKKPKAVVVEPVKEVPKVTEKDVEAERQARLEAERLEQEKQAQLEAEREEAERQAKLEAERLEQERQARLEAERREMELQKKLRAEKEKEITSQIINFPIGGSNISDSERTKLQTITAILKEYPEIRLELQGYSDSTGSRALNMKLTKERAESVRKVLIDSGIAANRLTAVGYGPDNPIAPNDTNAGRAKNRRVEFKVLK